MVSNKTLSAEDRKRLEEEKGIIIRFVIGHRSDSMSPNIHRFFQRTYIFMIVLLQLIDCTYLVYLFVYSSTSGGILDKAIEAEEKLHNDFLRLVIFLSCYFSFRYIILCPMCSVLFFFMKQNTSMFEQNHVEGYLALSAKTKTYFSTAVALWDAEFYVKVDDDVHVNLGKYGFVTSNHNC
jgi:hypothetical protein